MTFPQCSLRDQVTARSLSPSQALKQHVKEAERKRVLRFSRCELILSYEIPQFSGLDYCVLTAVRSGFWSAGSKRGIHVCSPSGLLGKRITMVGVADRH